MNTVEMHCASGDSLTSAAALITMEASYRQFWQCYGETPCTVVGDDTWTAVDAMLKATYGVVEASRAAETAPGIDPQLLRLAAGVLATAAGHLSAVAYRLDGAGS